MEAIEIFRALLGDAANGAMVAGAVALWRLEKRITVLELKLEQREG